MSSRLFRRGDPQIAVPVLWREIGVPEVLEGIPGVPEPKSAELQAQADAERSQLVEQARASGFREGEAAGRERAGAEVRPLIDRLARSIEELALLRPRLRKEAEADMLRLALAVARRVLRRELAVDPEALHGLAMAALEKLSSQAIHRVRVHPSLAPQVRAALEKLPGRASVEIVPDATREPGTVIFETARGDLDASVGTQLEEIERGLVDCLRRRS
jgi:flagellar assembly protein FliH